MKISRIQLDRMRLVLDPPFEAAWDPVPRRYFDATLVRVETDEGLTGYGSGDTMDGFEAFADLFTGKDPLQIANHVRTLETIGFHAGRYWPMEAALWDILGKTCGQPAATLFGGAADRLPAYASFGELRSPAARAEAALSAREAGFRAVKVRIGRADVASGLARGARGPGSCGRRPGHHGGPEPVVADGGRHLVRARRGGCAPDRRRAGGARRDLAGRAASCGGPGRARGSCVSSAVCGCRRRDGQERGRTARRDGRRCAGCPAAGRRAGCRDARGQAVAELALQQGRWFTPHTWTNGLGLLANLHVAAGVGGGPYLEFPYDPPGWTPQRRDFFLTEPVSIETDGTVRVPDRPGLGARIDEAAVARWSLA